MSTSTQNQKNITTQIKIASSVCAVENTLSWCKKENKEALVGFSKCLKSLYVEANKANPEMESMKKLFEGVKTGYSVTKDLIGQGGPSATALGVLKDNVQTLHALMETYTNHS